MPTNISDYAKFFSFLNFLQDLSDDDFDAVVDFAKTLRMAADKAGKKAPPSRDNDEELVFPPLKRTPWVQEQRSIPEAPISASVESR